MFLTFRDIAKSQLYLVNKLFYHNIIEDNELIYRIFIRHFGFIDDFDVEKEYMQEVLDKIGTKTDNKIS
jgi:hypothetical protein